MTSGKSKAGPPAKSQGYGVTVKIAALVALPPGVVTVIFPVVALAGTMKVSCVSEFRVNEITFPLPTVIALARIRPLFR
jgi:hypothetical protein